MSPLDDAEYADIMGKVDELETAVVDLVAENERLNAVLAAHHAGGDCLVCWRLEERERRRSDAD